MVTKRRGREKLHFLNPVPIRLVHDRWVSKYTEPWAAALLGLKNRMESPMEKVFEIYIRTTPERLWHAITDPEIRRKFQFGNHVTSDWTPGSRFEMTNPGARRAARRGREPRSRPAAATGADDGCAVGRRREERRNLAGHVGDRAGRRLVPPPVTHDQLREGANDQLYGGWPMILSGLKTWLETGELLTTPGSLMYG